MRKAIIDTEKCKECGLCIDSCPKKALSMTNGINSHGYKHIAIDQEKCIGCGICYLICPDAVFTIVEMEEN